MGGTTVAHLRALGRTPVARPIRPAHRSPDGPGSGRANSGSTQPGCLPLPRIPPAPAGPCRAGPPGPRGGSADCATGLRQRSSQLLPNPARLTAAVRVPPVPSRPAGASTAQPPSGRQPSQPPPTRPARRVTDHATPRYPEPEPPSARARPAVPRTPPAKRHPGNPRARLAGCPRPSHHPPSHSPASHPGVTPRRHTPTVTPPGAAPRTPPAPPPGPRAPPVHPPAPERPKSPGRRRPRRPCPRSASGGPRRPAG
ncbi:hypothetical protein ABIA38_008544 [Embleya sp. AB8]